MGARMEKAEGGPPAREEIGTRFEDEGLRPHSWENGPRESYGWHSHSYHKVPYCVSGGIVFHTSEGNFELEAGDRLEVDPGTEHAATVGSDGVQCMEAAR